MSLNTRRVEPSVRRVYPHCGLLMGPRNQLDGVARARGRSDHVGYGREHSDSPTRHWAPRSLVSPDMVSALMVHS